MKIEVDNAGKRFNREWIFRHFTQSFSTGNAYAITGPNGSGKSTFLQVLAGAQAASEGKITFFPNGPSSADPEQYFQYISIAAPYLEVVEEMSAPEFLRFHNTFKPLLKGFSIQDILAEVGLEKAKNKQIRLFSSGMKQRVKLAQAFFSDAPILLLDEPCTNLDKEGYTLYHKLIQRFAPHKLVVVASNDPQEYGFCNTIINPSGK